MIIDFDKACIEIDKRIKDHEVSRLVNTYGIGKASIISLLDNDTEAQKRLSKLWKHVKQTA